MIRAFSLAVAQLFSGPILGVLGACTMLSIACFAGLWFGIDWAIETWLDGSEGFLADLAAMVKSGIGQWFCLRVLLRYIAEFERFEEAIADYILGCLFIV